MKIAKLPNSLEGASNLLLLYDTKQLHLWSASHKENKLVIRLKVMEIPCSTCTKSKCSPAGFPVLVILILFFFGI